jgi:hypothetical protein
LGLVDRSLACPLVGLHAISAAYPEVRCFGKKTEYPRFSHEAPRFTPRPFSMIEQQSPIFRPAQAARLKSVALPSKGPAPRVWLPSRRRQPRCSWKPFSAPHTHGFCPSELFSVPVAQRRFPAVAPLLRFSVKPKGLTGTLQRFLLTGSAVHPAPGHILEPGWSHCSPELLRLSGFVSLDMGRSAFLLPAPLTLLSPTSEDVVEWSPRGFLPTTPRFPSFKGRKPV